MQLGQYSTTGWGHIATPAVASSQESKVLRCARIPRGCLLAAALGMAVSGCSSALKLSGLDEQQPLLTTATAPATSATARLRVGEQISVTVYGEASLSGNYLIDPNGIVSIPLAGKIKAVGLTTAELADILMKKFRSQYL